MLRYIPVYVLHTPHPIAWHSLLFLPRIIHCIAHDCPVLPSSTYIACFSFLSPTSCLLHIFPTSTPSALLLLSPSLSHPTFARPLVYYAHTTTTPFYFLIPVLVDPALDPHLSSSLAQNGERMKYSVFLLLAFAQLFPFFSFPMFAFWVFDFQCIYSEELSSRGS